MSSFGSKKMPPNMLCISDEHASCVALGQCTNAIADCKSVRLYLNPPRALHMTRPSPGSVSMRAFNSVRRIRA